MDIPKEVLNASVEELKEAEKHKDDSSSFTVKRHFNVSKTERFIVHRSHFKKTGGCVVIEFKSTKGNSKVVKRWNIKPSKP